MSFKEKTVKGLENILKKTALPISITAASTTLHEAVHAVSATILPKISCDGILLNNSSWYSRPLSWITLGYVKAKELPDTVAGYASISYRDDSTLTHISNAIATSLPEILTMTLGMYWIGSAVNNIRKKTEKISSLVKAYCGFKLIQMSGVVGKLISILRRVLSRIHLENVIGLQVMTFSLK